MAITPGAPGAAAPLGIMSREQKVKLLWGSKKQQVEKTVNAEAVFGTNRWDAAEFDNDKEKSKFIRLMVSQCVSRDAVEGRCWGWLMREDMVFMTHMARNVKPSEMTPLLNGPAG